MANESPTQLDAWQTLAKLAVNPPAIRPLVDADSRLEQYSTRVGGLFADFSKHCVNDEILEALLALAEATGVTAKRDAMLAGEAINTTEDRQVLHTALRGGTSEHRVLIDQQLAEVERISAAVRNGQWQGVTGKRIRHVINIGIGGSDLGPKMVCTALREYAHPELTTHFVSNVDGAEIRHVLQQCSAEQTLVIISSKTFTTQETMINARVALTWLEQSLGVDNAAATDHVIAVTASPEVSSALGVKAQNTLTFWDFVGGRYSLWSTIGVSIAITNGFEHFRALLDGAAHMDQHFARAPIHENLPVLLGLLGIWYSNFLGAQSTAVIPYCERLSFLPPFLQQLDMESNGKQAHMDGSTADHATGPIVWGQTGTNGQHAFFQLLHQGAHLVPVDFIAVLKDRLSEPSQHRILLANMVAQASALMNGEASDNAHRHYPGNKPSTTLLLDELTPFNLGLLIAMFEHRVFVQGAVWNINSFDQWGVELGKKIANQILDNQADQLDASTRSLLKLLDG